MVSGIGVGANVVGETVVSGLDVVVESSTGFVVVEISKVVDDAVLGVFSAHALNVTAQAPTKMPNRVTHRF